MLQIYLGHSTGYDYQSRLYLPIKNSELWHMHQFILPHDAQTEPIHSKKSIAHCNMMLAEVSYPSTGLGIELGWANELERPILCMYQEGHEPSKSLQLVCKHFICYSDEKSLVQRLTDYIN